MTDLTLTNCPAKCLEAFWRLKRAVEMDGQLLCPICEREPCDVASVPFFNPFLTAAAVFQLHHLSYRYGYYTAPSWCLIGICRSCHREVEKLKLELKGSSHADSFDICKQLREHKRAMRPKYSEGVNLLIRILTDDGHSLACLRAAGAS